MAADRVAAAAAGAAVCRAARAASVAALLPFAGRSDAAFGFSAADAAGRGFCARGPVGVDATALVPALRDGCSERADFDGFEDMSAAGATPVIVEPGFSGARADVTRGDTTARLLPLGGGSDPVTAAYPLLYSA